MQISHIHTVPKSTSESQTQITHLLTAPEPARGKHMENRFLVTMSTSTNKRRYKNKLTRLTTSASMEENIAQN